MKLNPVICEITMIVGGRFKPNAEIFFESRQPVILARDATISNRIIMARNEW